MGIKVAATCLHWSQSVVPHSPSSSQTLASAIVSPSKRRGRNDRTIVCQIVPRGDQSSLFRTSSIRFLRSRSCEYTKTRGQTLKRAASASSDGSFSEEEMAEHIRELAFKFFSNGDSEIINNKDIESDEAGNSRDEESGSHNGCFNEDLFRMSSIINPVQIPIPFSPWNLLDSVETPWLGISPEPPDWPERDDIIPANIERKANSVNLPLSLRMIKKKRQWKEGFREAGESAYCSVKKAFSSMVFIIRELHSYALQMREILFYEDLQGILDRVQKEMHASFVWLFQQVFSHTPTLMVYVMILLANFTVYSMRHNTAIAAPTMASGYSGATVETVTMTDIRNQKQSKFDGSTIKTFSVSSSAGKSTFVGGSNGGGGKVRPVASGTDGDGRFDGSSSWNENRTIVPDEISRVSSFGNPTSTQEGGESETVMESESQEGTASEEEVNLWNAIVEEACRLQESMRDEALDHETTQRFVSPIKVEIEPEDYTDYLRTELMYQLALSQEPGNPLILANYAQFLYLVVRDHDRAEEYFKRAIKGVEPPDAESLSRYATFLWVARKDVCGAEETFLEAIAADPGNSAHAANYAHFLWNTGAEDTCFPLDAPDDIDSNDA
ncbi:PREDICTED: uncharacterized protein LOC104596966 [Nelumbo nucifera]|uniref:Uncharacterized protein LOC104596966 n=1 Tax=Nelumbo nucifera TaxID=4432 RepID=A0A1U8Q5E5_NELNU|nr:PREDICTED: uncharacterized protein LOC104596966 [Nelumbo nucifera]XP_019053251.1 PREDICTED: uncharacterized protein LOC104596966 [Nelumbo nucifera]